MNCKNDLSKDLEQVLMRFEKIKADRDRYKKMWNSLAKHIEKQKEKVVRYYADNDKIIEEGISYDNDEMSIRATLLKMDELEELLGVVEIEKENDE